MPTGTGNDLNYRFTGDDSSFKAAASRVAAAFDTLNQKAKTFSKNLKQQSTSATTASKNLDKTTSSAKKLGASLSSATTLTRLLKRAFVSLTGLSLGAFFAKATYESIEFVENLNLFRVAMGDTIKVAEKFINTMSEQFGLDPSALMRSYGIYQNLTKTMGLTDDQATLLSQNFVKLGNDLASLWNTSVEQAWEALESGLVGLTKPLRQYGVDITQASLQQTALSLGIDESVRSMRRANKAGLIYITVMRSATSSMGDFARTIESPANQLRILQQQFKQLSRAMGDFFLGTIGKLLPYLNGAVMALTAILRTFANLMGIKVGDFASAVGGVSSEVGDLGDQATDAANKMKKLIAPFDELNVLSEESGGGEDVSFGGGGMNQAILDAMEEYNNRMDEVQMKAVRVRDRLMEILGFTKHINEETGEITWTWNFEDMKAGLKSGWDQMIEWFNGLNPGGKLAAIILAGFTLGMAGKFATLLYKLFLKPFVDMATGIGTQASKISEWIKKINWGEMGTKASGATKAVSTAFSGMSTVTVGVIFAIILAIVAFIAAIGDLWKNSEDFRNSVIEIWTDIKEKVSLLVNAIWTNALEPLWQDLKRLATDIQNLFKLLWTILEPIFSTTWGGFKDFVSGAVQGVLLILDGLITFLTGIFSGDLSMAIDGIGLIFKGLAGIVASVFGGITNIVVDALNWVIGKLNEFSVSIPNWPMIFGSMAGQTFGFNIGLLPRWDPSSVAAFAGLARGGILEGGQPFYAGENGKAEMLGSYQGKTTVMPLEDTSFVRAIGTAVREGVVSGLQAQGSATSGGQPLAITVNVGGKKFERVVYDAYTRESKTRGAAIMGGVLYGNG